MLRFLRRHNVPTSSLRAACRYPPTMDLDKPQDRLLDSSARTDLALPSEHKQALLREAMEGVCALPASLLLMPSIWRTARPVPPTLSLKFVRIETPDWPQNEFRLSGAPDRLTGSPELEAAFGISDAAPCSTSFGDDSIYSELNRRLIAEFNWDKSMSPATVALHSRQIVRERIARLEPAFEEAGAQRLNTASSAPQGDEQYLGAQRKHDDLKLQLDEAKWWLEKFAFLQSYFEGKDRP